MVEKIGAGHKSDVTYPSEDNMKVKIIIPAELFKTRGILNKKRGCLVYVRRKQRGLAVRGK